jgi:hypothetical protein
LERSGNDNGDAGFSQLEAPSSYPTSPDARIAVVRRQNPHRLIKIFDDKGADSGAINIPLVGSARA